MKKAILLDTNVSSFPIYQFLINRGYDTYVMGSNPNDCLAKCTKNYINGNYSDTPFLKELIKTHGFDVVVPGCNDVSYMSAAKVNDDKFYGLDSVETTSTINNKHQFRMFGLSNNLSVPKIFTDIEACSQTNPIIVKPVDAYSGRGVTVINNPNKNDIDAAINLATSFSSSKKYIIEEYIKGQLYSHTAFISNKKITNDFIVVENGTTNEFTVDTSHVVYDFPKKLLACIRKEIEYISNKLNLVDGLVHTQFIKTDNSFRIVEVTRRCPGDLYALLIEKSTGFKYAEEYAKPFIGEAISKSKSKVKKSHIIRHTLSVAAGVNMIGVNYFDKLNIDLFIPMTKTGEEVKKSPFGRIGLIFIKCKSSQELTKINKIVLKRKLYGIF